MNTGAIPETKHCYFAIDVRAILEILKNNLVAIQIGNKEISILLEMPRYSKNNDLFDLGSTSLQAFMSDTFKPFAP